MINNSVFKNWIFHGAIALLCASALPLSGCNDPVRRDPNAAPLRSVSALDINRYQGTWYEIARFPNTFQEDCAGNVTAEYTPQSDGTIQVLNRCLSKPFIDHLSRSYIDATGEATIPDPKKPAELKVKFNIFATGDYWVLILDSDYQYSVVGEPSGKYLWILSRSPNMSKDVLANLYSKLNALGYQTDQLVLTRQGI